MDVAKLSYGLRGNEEDFRKCFMRSMGSRGTVTTQFSIDSSGAVHDARVVHSSIGQAGVEQCLIDELRSLDFGNQALPSENRFTFVFRLTEPLTDRQRKDLLKKAERQADQAIKLMPESRGTLDLDHVAEVVQARYSLYAHCYRDSIQRRGESRGVVRFRLHVDDAGSVVNVEDDGSVMPDPFAVDCMAEAFYLMRFDPPASSPVVLRYSMALE